MYKLIYKRALSVMMLTLATTTLMAQPKQVTKMADAAVAVRSYDAKDNLISTMGGVFVSADGTALGTWSAFAGAARVEVCDAKGHTYAVESIIGANELYDVCRFRCSATSPKYATLTKSGVAEGASLWTVVTTAGAKPSLKQYAVKRKESFNGQYDYAVFAYNDEAGIPGTPFVNENGEVTGLLQRSETSLDVYSVDARFANELGARPLDISSQLYQRTGVRLAMPADNKADAQLMLVLAGELGDSAKYAGYINDYIRLYPKEVDGYSASAMRKMALGDFDGADADMADCMRNADDKAEAHSEWARVMYNKILYSADTLYAGWTLDAALGHAIEACRLNPQAGYTHRAAQILYTKGDYAEALRHFTSLYEGEMHNAEVFYEAAQCKAALGGQNEEILALLDSAVAVCGQPYTMSAAPYLLARGQMRGDMGNLRGALADYNVYDSLYSNRADHSFYYLRYKCEVALRQYQQALDDIAHAAYVSPEPSLYLAELASLQLRVNRLEDAVKSSALCLNFDPENTDALVIRGVALAMLQRKDEAMESFIKARDLGDSRGAEYIDTYDEKFAKKKK